MNCVSCAEKLPSGTTTTSYLPGLVEQ